MAVVAGALIFSVTVHCSQRCTTGIFELRALLHSFAPEKMVISAARVGFSWQLLEAAGFVLFSFL
jgi:hypothetical protein